VFLFGKEKAVDERRVRRMAELKNKRHEAFVQEYLIDLNQTQAAIRAGYSPVSAAQTGSEIMSNPKVRARVDELMAERSRRTGVNADRVVRELAKLAFINADQVINFTTAEVKPDASEDDLAAVAGMKVKYVPHKSFDDAGEPVIDTAIEREVKLSDKTKALELLGKHLGLFTDKVSLEMVQPVFDGEDGLED